MKLIITAVAVVLLLSFSTATQAEDRSPALPSFGSVSDSWKQDIKHEALAAHGNTSDLDRLEQDCDGRVCVYHEPRLVGSVTYDTAFGEQTVVYGPGGR